MRKERSERQWQRQRYVDSSSFLFFGCGRLCVPCSNAADSTAAAAAAAAGGRLCCYFVKDETERRAT